MHARSLWLSLSLFLLLPACSPDAPLLPAATATVAATPTIPNPSPLIATSSPAPTATPVPLDSGWQQLQPGLEQRTLNVVEDGNWQESLTVLRLDPERFHFDVAYRPGLPQSLATWQAETGALLVVNGGFYTERYEATGLIVSDGIARGHSYDGFGGMFVVTDEGPELRSLQAQPYNPTEEFQAGLQSFPLLVKPGGSLGFPEEDGQQARRTVVAQDTAGRLLFLVAPRGHFTLHQLSRYLVASDLELDVALNLDGGPSTGLLLRQPPLFVPAFVPLPAVITVLEKQD